MEFSDLKKWHIALALIIFSGAIVFSYLSLEPQANARTTSPLMFQQSLMSKPVGKENPIPRVQNVRIYPPVDGLYTVNFDQLVEDRQNDRWLKQQWSFTARSANPGSNQTILEWMKQLKDSDPERISYTYEWWREPTKLYSIWAAFSVILAVWGIVIPTTMWVAKGGMKDFKEVASSKPTATAAELATASRSGVTAEDQDRLSSMIDRLEESSATSSSPSSKSASHAPAGSTLKGDTNPINRIMESKPLEAPTVPTTPEEEKDYKGEFYPVVRPHGKKE